MGIENKTEVLGLTRMTKKGIQLLCKKNSLYQTPKLNDVLYLHYQGYQEIECLQEYTGLKCLWLECNAISDIKGLENQKLLKCLFLQNNLIKKIENLENCRELDTINLSHNHIICIENCGVDKLPVLTSLNLANNYLRTLENLNGLKECKMLSVLDLSNNRIEDILIVKLVGQMPELRVLVLMGNPVVNEIPQYRKTLILECEQLNYLDTRPVFPKDRACAEAWKRGGYEEERREHDRWNKMELKKIRDSVNATIRLRNQYKNAVQMELLKSSDDEEGEADGDENETADNSEDQMNAKSSEIKKCGSCDEIDCQCLNDVAEKFGEASGFEGVQNLETTEVNFGNSKENLEEKSEELFEKIENSEEIAELHDVSQKWDNLYYESKKVSSDIKTSIGNHEKSKCDEFRSEGLKPEDMELLRNVNAEEIENEYLKCIKEFMRIDIQAKLAKKRIKVTIDNEDNETDSKIKPTFNDALIIFEEWSPNPFRDEDEISRENLNFAPSSRNAFSFDAMAMESLNYNKKNHNDLENLDKNCPNCVKIQSDPKNEPLRESFFDISAQPSEQFQDESQKLNEMADIIHFQHCCTIETINQELENLRSDCKLVYERLENDSNPCFKQEETNILPHIEGQPFEKNEGINLETDFLQNETGENSFLHEVNSDSDIFYDAFSSPTSLNPSLDGNEILENSQELSSLDILNSILFFDTNSMFFNEKNDDDKQCENGYMIENSDLINFDWIWGKITETMDLK